MNTDASVRLLKGPGRPIQPLRTRMAILTRVPVVDAVIPFDGNQLALIESIRPDIVVKGSDYTAERVIGHTLVQSYGGSIRIVERVKGISTTESLNSPAELAMKHP